MRLITAREADVFVERYNREIDLEQEEARKESRPPRLPDELRTAEGAIEAEVKAGGLLFIDDNDHRITVWVVPQKPVAFVKWIGRERTTEDAVFLEVSKLLVGMGFTEARFPPAGLVAENAIDKTGAVVTGKLASVPLAQAISRLEPKVVRR